MRLGVVLPLLLALLLAAPAYAQEWNAYTSCDDTGFSRNETNELQRYGLCASTDLEQLHQAFNAPSLRDLAGAGGQAVRLIVLDDYRRPVVVAEASRPRGERALAIARGLGDPGRRAPDVMQGVLDPFVWTAVAAGARAQRRARGVAPPPPPLDDDEIMIICMHGWTTILETYGFGAPRTLTRNSCDADNATHEFSWTLGQLVFAAFPDCAVISPENHRNTMTRLAWCLAFSGEIAPAVGAENVAQLFYDNNFTSERVRFLLADDFSLTLPDEPSLPGAAPALERWRTFVAGGAYETGFNGGVGAEDERGQQTAELHLLLFDDSWAAWERSARFAEVTQTWRRDDDGIWLLASMQVGPFEVFRFPD